MSPVASQIAVYDGPDQRQESERLAQQLSLVLSDVPAESSPFDFLLMLTPAGLALQQTGRRAPGPVRVDFAGGTADYRRTKGGGELIVKAVGGKGLSQPTLVDATAGLGRDSFVLASKGFQVTLCERSPIIAALLEDGLQRARNSDDPNVVAVAQNMTLHGGNAIEYLRSLTADQHPDIVYIDPMFPPSRKSAQVKKEMQAFQAVVGADADSEQLLEVALTAAQHRVVVKRPLKGKSLSERSANFSVEGKAIRFDVYTIRAFPKS